MSLKENPILAINEELSRIIADVKEGISHANSNDQIRDIERKYILDKDSRIRKIASMVKDVPSSTRAEFGIKLNNTKKICLDVIRTEKDRINSLLKESLCLEEKRDVTIPGVFDGVAKKTITQDVIDSIKDALSSLGFAVLDEIEIEDDFHNFLALNFPLNHPARDMQDTCYLDTFNKDGDRDILRTHTSNMQIRCLLNVDAKDLFDEEKKVACVVSGKCFRNEDISYRSHMFFHQVEVFLVAKSASISDLLGCIDFILMQVFGEKVEKRVRSSYFPFVEPGMEIDVACFLCNKTGCQVCKNSGWLELLGAGIIHDKVLSNTMGEGNGLMGYAIGLGIERIAMMKHNIKDIRHIHDGRLSILN